MLFDALDKSRFLARPVRLFEFFYQNEVWRFASSNRVETTPGGVVWYPVQIERDEVRITSEKAKDKLTIRMPYLLDPFAPLDALPATQPIGDLWRPYLPSGIVRVALYDWMVGAEDAPKQVWSGHARQPEFGDVQMDLTCFPGGMKGEMQGQGLVAQHGCPKLPYSTGIRGCNLDPLDYEIAATVATVTGVVLTSPAFASSTFSLRNGLFRWTRAVTRQDGTPTTREEHRRITHHAGDTIHLSAPGIGLVDGMSAIVRPHCEGTRAACEARNNTNNYGGSDYMPIRVPGKAPNSWG